MLKTNKYFFCTQSTDKLMIFHTTKEGSGEKEWKKENKKRGRTFKFRGLFDVGEREKGEKKIVKKTKNDGCEC